MWWLVLHAAAAGLLAALLIQTLLNLVRLPRLGRARRPAVLPRAAVLPATCGPSGAGDSRPGGEASPTP